MWVAMVLFDVILCIAFSARICLALPASRLQVFVFSIAKLDLARRLPYPPIVGEFDGGELFVEANAMDMRRISSTRLQQS